MTVPWGGIAGIAVAYCAGSFPSAYLAGRLVRGIDLRTVGSGNLGATNVYRQLGLAPALLVLAADLAKGALPPALLPGLLGAGPPSEAAGAWWALAFGAAAIAGHAKPVFLGWKGSGKGVATAAGVFLALTPGPAFVAVSAFAVVVVATRFVSLGSIVGAVSLPTAQLVTDGLTPAFYASTAIAAFVCWAHRTNIQRLRLGTEPRLTRHTGSAA